MIVLLFKIYLEHHIESAHIIYTHIQCYKEKDIVSPPYDQKSDYYGKLVLTLNVNSKAGLELNTSFVISVAFNIEYGVQGH